MLLGTTAATRFDHNLCEIMTTTVELQKLVDIANKLVWKAPNVRVLRAEMMGQYSVLSTILQMQIEASHSRGKLILPDLAAFSNETVAVFSDYSGEGSGDYFTYSFLICAWDLVGGFNERMKQVRAKHGLGDKEIAFKDFRMGQLQRALPEYLWLLDSVPGFLFTLVVEKEISSLFTTQDRPARQTLVDTLAAQGFGDWKIDTTEKLLRVVHTTALFTALLARPGQKLFWMSDNDEICPNEDRHKLVLKLFGQLLGLYTEQAKSFQVIGGGTPFETRHIETLDLLSVCDVVSGSVEHYLTKKDECVDPEFPVKAGAHHILRWLAHEGVGLKKMTSIIRKVSSGHFQGANLEFSLKEPPSDITLIPVIV